MSQTSYSRDTKVAIEVVVYCPKFMLQYVVHNNIIIMKYSSPSIVILSLNSKRIQCNFSRAFLGITIDDSIVFLSQFMEGVAGWWGAGGIKGGGAHYLAEWQDI